MGGAAVRGVIFDLDGTLLDTNAAHVEAWVQGFAAHGFAVPAERVRPEVGKGGDKLLPAVLGEEVERAQGDAIRASVSERFRRIARAERFRVFDGAEALLEALRARGLRLALATSSREADLDLMMESAGVELRGWFDVVVTKSDVEASKPAPDVVERALEQLGLPAVQCLMVGDTEYDVVSAGRAGVAAVGVLTAGIADEATLRERLLRAGAVGVWRDVGSMAADVDVWLGLGEGERERERERGRDRES
jgi:HAD superfamily hydrolase (TIGR01509 family)